MPTKMPIISLACLTCGLLAAAPARADPPVAIDSKFYYEIGGADSITAAPNPQAAVKTYRASASLGLGYSCLKFDKTLGVANLINTLQNTGNALVNGAVGAVNAAIGALPMLILQRVNPGLYDLFQNLLIRAEAVIQVATESCEQMERKIAEGKNPFEDWVIQAKFNDWKAQMGTGGFSTSAVNAKTAQDNVEKNNGANGVPWSGGANAGGSGQPPIRTTYDVVVAGYNITLNRPANDPSKPANDPETTPLVKIWEDPGKAGEWAVQVLGEALIRTHDGRDTETTPGYGLLRKIPDEVNLITADVNALIASSQPPDLVVLEKISTPGTLITADVIRTLRNLEPVDRAMVVDKLAAEVAMSRVMEKAITLRRLLLTGKREPNVSATEAPKYVDESVGVLDQEIDGILFEKRVRKELFAATSAALIDLDSRRSNAARPVLERKKEDGAPMRDSAVPAP